MASARTKSFTFSGRKLGRAWLQLNYSGLDGLFRAERDGMKPQVGVLDATGGEPFSHCRGEPFSASLGSEFVMPSKFFDSVS